MEANDPIARSERALLAMGVSALAGFFHYVKMGPNDADAEDEKSESNATH